jgi:enoyl-CoA hydratase/carnithine racemase
MSILKYKIEGHTAIWTLNNPPAHTFTQEILGAVPSFIDELSRNREVYSLVIHGDGEKFFSAGADLKLFQSGDKTIARDMAAKFGRAFEAISAFRGVTIAAINGYAMGGGLECALACDTRIAESHSIMALPEASVGLLPCAGGTQNLAHLVGEAWAKRMILCGERLGADKALELGLVEEVCEKGESLARALELAKKVENQSPTSISFCKALIQMSRSRPLSHALPTERECFVDLFDSEDQKEGVSAFLEKRKPTWKNA